jgi:hypothetical protein
MSSETDVINTALRRVGAERITSRLDGTKAANVANDIYDGILNKFFVAIRGISPPSA